MFIHVYIVCAMYMYYAPCLICLYIPMLQAIVGDQLMCKTIRGSKRWRPAEVDPKERLTRAHEIPHELNLHIIQFVSNTK